MIKVELHSAGVEALLHDRGVAADLRRRGEAVESAAKASAPVVTGAYRDSIEAVSAVTDRAVCWVASSVPYAGVIEADTGNLARAIDAGLG